MVSKKWAKKMSGTAVKDEEANQTLFFKRLENNFVHKRPFGPSIFPGTKENLLNFSFYKNIPNYNQCSPPSSPFKMLLTQECCCCFNSTGPQIYCKSESNIQIFCSETIISFENWGRRAHLSNAAFNGGRPMTRPGPVHCCRF